MREQEVEEPSLGNQTSFSLVTVNELKGKKRAGEMIQR